MNQHTLKYQLLADLLATLEAEEFPIGVGKHLELQQLYSMLPEDIKPEEMKTLLAPIFAKNKQDQEFFYDVFDQSLKHIEAKTWEPKDQPITPILPPKSKWEIITRLLGLTLFLVAVTLTYLRISGNQPLVMPPICEQELVVEPDSIYILNLLDSIALENELREKLIKGASLEFVSFLNGETVGEIPEIGTYQIDSNGIFSIKTIEDFDERNESFVVTAIAKYELGTDTTNFIIKQKEEIIEEVEVKLPPAKKYSSLSLEPHPFPKVLPFPKQPPQWISNFQKYKYWIKPILIFLLFAMFGAYLNWWAERQQKIIADIQSKNDPPLLWNIQIPNISKISLNEDYFKVLQLMRQRTSDDHYVLNIAKTIDKTIEKGGIIDFQYQHKTKPPEYLLLIDRQSSKNHRAYLYNYLFESFKANEVYIERFFYEGDIRLCWNEYYPNGIKLHDLQQTFRDARLIIVGSGYQLLNPVSGKLAKWTRIFDNWSDKAILSPRPTKNWAGREKQLKRKFILLPASVQSLTTMVDKMEAIDPEEIKTKINDEVNEPIEFRGSLIDTLRHYFSIKKTGEPRDESLMHWIAACAIYPTLHWDLTMYLGQELSTEDKNLLTFDNINQLTRLPWFVEGKIPEQARLELLEYLPEDVELNLRKSLQDLFETIPPPDENSVAFADSRINISLNKYLLEKNNLLKTELNQYARAGADIDVTMLKYLEGEKSPKDFVVDPNLRRYAEGKKPKVDLNRRTKFLAFIVMVFLTSGIILYSPNFESCKGELIQFNDLELCLSTPDDHLIYRAAQIRNYINQNNYALIDRLEKEAIKQYFLFNSGQRTVAEIGEIQKANYSIESIIPFVQSDTSILHFYQNLAVDFYNHGVPSYNRFDSLDVTLDEYYNTSGDSIKFCTAFEEANFYDFKIISNGVSRELSSILAFHCSGDDNNIMVTGRDVEWVSFSNEGLDSPDGFFIKEEGGSWKETGSDGEEARFIFKEINRNERSVYLLDETRDMKIQLDMFDLNVIFSQNGSEEGLLGKILEWGTGLGHIPTTNPPKKVLALKIGGRVFDKGTNNRLAKAEVVFLGKKVITNSRGRYEFDVPLNDPSKDFDLKYGKENYSEITKVYDRNEITVLEKDKDIVFQLEDVFMEQLDQTTKKRRQTIERLFSGTAQPRNSAQRELLREFSDDENLVKDLLNAVMKEEHFKNGILDPDYPFGFSNVVTILSELSATSLRREKDSIEKFRREMEKSSLYGTNTQEKFLQISNKISNKISNETSDCFFENKAVFFSYMANQAYKEAVQRIEILKECSLGDSQRNEIQEWEKELALERKKLIEKGDALFNEKLYFEAIKAYKTASLIDETYQLTTKINISSDILNNKILLDNRDNKRYYISKLKDGKYWMMQNLNYETQNSFCVDNYSSNCEKYGRLYTWNAARNACPNGWRLPSKDEWETMLNLYGSDPSNIYSGLSYLNFTNQTGGYGGKDKKFYYVGEAGVIWTSSRDSKIKAFMIDFNLKSKEINIGSRLMVDANSCRCVKDEEKRK